MSFHEAARAHIVMTHWASLRQELTPEAGNESPGFSSSHSCTCLRLRARLWLWFGHVCSEDAADTSCCTLALQKILFAPRILCEIRRYYKLLELHRLPHNGCSFFEPRGIALEQVELHPRAVDGCDLLTLSIVLT